MLLTTKSLSKCFFVKAISTDQKKNKKNKTNEKRQIKTKTLIMAF